MNYAAEMTRFELMRRNNGEPPREIDAERYDYLLCVLPPANWTRGKGNFSCFMVDECQTAKLYTWCARLDDGTHWEMIAPEDSTPSELLAKIETARRVSA
jgi:hypothetical protein